ncbi:MAG TPA: DUF433 domain-containing protein [Vicinamibacteria bacterium]|nr:DUF433 domain-containing protein [Vicinamibacteria bacterium]
MDVMAATARAAVGYPHVEKTLGVCGGKACIAGTRIRVLDIVGLRRRGFEPEEMLRMYAVPLTLAQVHAALAYYYDHPEEIEASIREGRKLVARIRIDQGRAVRQRRRSR